MTLLKHRPFGRWQFAEHSFPKFLNRRGEPHAMGTMKGTIPCDDRFAEVRSVSCRRQTARQRAKVSGEEGSALVETSLVIPIIFLMMTGIFSFSIALYQKLELAQAVASGARYLSVDRGDTDPCAAAVAKIYAAAPTLTQSSITTTFVLNGTTYNGKTCSGTTNMVSGGNAQLTATYPCTLSVYGKSFGSCTLTENVTEVIQ
jgi:Flp pilus assembly protein TadG